MNDNQLLLIDLSSIAHPIWHVSGKEPDQDHVSTQTVVKVRQLAQAHPHAAVCCDSGKSFRADVDPTYKANRPESLAPLQHQITLAMEQLRKDGFPVWAVRGFEADDLIATATRLALEMDPDVSVLIASADKDLLQLVNGRVCAKSLKDGSIVDEDAVIFKFGVRPDQMLDYLCLVGDASDNVKGAKGIGSVRAATLLKKYGSLDAIYAAFDKGATPDITPQQRTDLQEFRARRAVVRELIALRTDVEIPFAEIAAERVAKAMEEEPMSERELPEGITPEAGQCAEYFSAAQRMDAIRPATSDGSPTAQAQPESAARPEPSPAAVLGFQQRQRGTVPQAPNDPPQALIQASSHAPVSWDQQLEPRSMDDAIRLAQRMYDSRLFSAYGTPQAVLSTILAGRELGMSAMSSLRSFHIIEGKPTLSAGAIQALVLKSGKARYFRCTERTDERATFVTKRGDDPEIALTYTIAEGRAAWTRDESKWKASGWGRNPADMCVARAGSKLARLVYPDVVAGLYDPSEVE